MLKRDESIMLLKKGWRHSTLFTVAVVLGSKIWFLRTGCPVHGFRMLLPFESLRGGPNMEEKSPPRNASVGSVFRAVPPVLWRSCSKAKKKNVLSRPL